MNKYSPGPWKIERSSELNEAAEMPSCIGSGVDGEFYVATVEHPVNRFTGRIRLDSEQAANARLIASAPDMLDKLEVALRRLKEKNDGSNRDNGLILAITQLLNRIEGKADT